MELSDIYSQSNAYRKQVEGATLMMTPDAYRHDLKYVRIFLVSLTFMLIISSNVQAQCPVSSPSPAPTPDTSKKNNATKTGETETPSNEPAKTSPIPPFPLSISDVRVVDPDSSGAAGLNNTIVVKVNCLKEELARQDDPKNGVQEKIDPRKFVLFLNNTEIKKLSPEKFDEGNGELYFRLRRDSDSRGAWQDFLARPTQETVALTASVGPEGKWPFKGGKPFPFRIYSKLLLKVGVALFIVSLIGFLVAAKRTTIIRDSGPPKPVGGPRKRPYSLARAQVAWWFFIILGSFLFIGLVTWDIDTITSSSLVLLGIGTGTALGAAMVDANKRESSDSAIETLRPKEAQLMASIAELKTTIMSAEQITAGADPSLIANLASKRTELATLEAQLQEVRSQLDDAASGLQKPESEGPLVDLLSDVNGVTFHRFQIVVWTVVLGLIFIYSVWTSLTMPQFSDTLLALMGISAGTYVGFKIPERQTDPADAPNMNTAPGVNPSDNADPDADTDPQTEEEGC